MSAPIPIKKLILEDLTDGEGNLNTAKLIEQLNNFMSPVYDVLNQGLVTGRQKTVPFSTGSNLEKGYPFFLKVPGITRPRKAMIIECVNTTTGKPVLSGVFANVEPSNGDLKVHYISGLDPNTDYQITFLVLP